MLTKLPIFYPVYYKQKKLLVKGVVQASYNYCSKSCSMQFVALATILLCPPQNQNQNVIIQPAHSSYYSERLNNIHVLLLAPAVLLGESLGIALFRFHKIPRLNAVAYYGLLYGSPDMYCSELNKEDGTPTTGNAA